MAKKMINREHIEGRVYEHDLALKTVQNTESKNYGKNFINGTLSVATDEACLNIVQIHFTYVTEVTSKGNANATYSALKNIIESGKTIVIDGKDAATMVSIDTALDLNDFYTNRNGEETLVSAKRNEGGFVTIVRSLNEDEKVRNQFEVDMVINNIRTVEADPEKNIDKDYRIIKGAVFNFRNAILPVEFTVRSDGGIKYFDSLDISPSNLVFTKVWGQIQSQTVVTKIEEETAFGEPAVRETTRTSREWEVTRAAREPYAFDDESTITKDELQKMMADREVTLADIKKRQEEYQASRQTAAPASNVANAPASEGGFNF